MQITRQGPTRITRQTIDTVWRRRSPGTRAILLDLECRGLALVVNATSMAWSYSYKPRGLDPATDKRFATKSLTLGNPETHSPGGRPRRRLRRESGGRERTRSGRGAQGAHREGCRRALAVRRPARCGLRERPSPASPAARPRDRLPVVRGRGDRARPRRGRGYESRRQADRGDKRRRSSHVVARRSGAARTPRGTVLTPCVDFSIGPATKVCCP